VQVLQRHQATIQKLRAVNNLAAASVLDAVAAAGVENHEHPALLDWGLTRREKQAEKSALNARASTPPDQRARSFGLGFR
jgi:hypothetical protein